MSFKVITTIGKFLRKTKQKRKYKITSVQFSSVAQFSSTLCDPMNGSTPGFQSITNSRSSLRLMSIESMPSSHLILCHPLLFLTPIPPSIRGLFQWVNSSHEVAKVSALASVLPMNTQDWSPLECTGWSSLQSKGLSRVFSNTTVQKHQFFNAQLSSQSNSHIHTWLLEKS